MHLEKRKVQINKRILGILIFIIAILFFVFFIPQPKVNIARFNEFIQNPKNGLFILKKINGVDVSLAYRPAALIAYQTCRVSRADSINTGEKDSCFRASYNDALKFHYFLLSISANEKEILRSPQAQRRGWQQISYYLSFTLEKEAMLITDRNDTVFPSLVHYPRLYGTSTSTDLMMVFPQPATPPDDYFSVVIPDFGFSTGTIRFKYKKKDIEDIPRLKI